MGEPKQIPVYRPWLTEEVFESAREALEMGWLGMGSYVGEFEHYLSSNNGAEVRHAAALSTGHAALHLALLLIGVGAGDEIITPSFNNIADFQAILATNASPVFCDCRDDTLCIDLEKAEAVISEKTKAIIVMDYGSHLADHDRAQEIATRRGIRIIHDAAHSFGSRYKGKPIGSFSDITMFSFDPVKTITTIDGGALLVRTVEELEQIREMRLIGMKQRSETMYQNQRAWNYDVERLGFRYHLANLHAAIGLAQLRKFDEITQTRQETFRRYREGFKDLSWLRIPGGSLDEIVPFMFYVRILDGRRDEFRNFLMERRIETGIHWQPGHWFTLLNKCRREELPVTERVAHEIVSLPFHSKMANDEVDRVIDSVRAFNPN